MNLHDQLCQRLDAAASALGSLRSRLPEIVAAAEALIACLQAGGTIYSCGNGGSAAQALHLAEELIGRYRSNRSPLRAVCLNADATALTCIANDFGYDEVFARQCEGLARPGDALVGFSTSGRSASVVNALRIAKQRGVVTVGVLGKDGGTCREWCDHVLLAGGDDSGVIQDAHQVVLHLLCEAIEQAFVGK